ncbi:MAG: xanthine dehydrogenase family protein molybdopterin-binding subunit [Pseudomonadota bacterium]
MLKFLHAKPAAATLNRRRFLAVSSLGTAGFVIGCSDARQEAGAIDDASATAAPVVESDLNAFVRIGSDDTVTVIVKHLDKGQGVSTGLPTIVAEELDADWSQMRFEFAPSDVARYANTLFGIQGTGGSTAIANSYPQLRNAAAAARAMLVAAAAQEWGVEASQIVVSKGLVSHADTDKAARFGALAEAAALMTPPAEPSLKSPADFSLIGTRLPRLDSPAKTQGTAQYTIDTDVPDMKVAVVAHPPRFGGVVKTLNATAAQALPGVLGVYQIPRGVAVVADSFWTAKTARDALEIEWDDSAAEQRSTDRMMADFKAMAANPGAIARSDGDADKALAGASKVIDLEFELPFLAHATMEPMDCVVHVNNGRCDIWTGSQLQTLDQQNAASAAGVPMSDVHIHTLYAGGSFGRRAVPDSDYILEAVSISRAVGEAHPIKLQWTREDDFQAGRYRPMGLHQARAGIDEGGRPLGWQHRIVTQSFMLGTPFESGSIKDGVDSSSVEGAEQLPYAIDDVTVDLHLARTPVPTLWWRSVGHTHNAWVAEVMIDQLAKATGKDEVAYRLELLKDHPRHRGVLELVAEKTGWEQAPAEGVFRGVAVHESFNSYVAHIAEITIGDNGALQVERVVAAVDCGVAINPDVIRAQVEGAVGMGVSAFMREAVNLDDGLVREQNFHQYRPLRINEMPQVEVHIVASAEAPTGIGEPGLPPVAPALTNAIASATGKVITKLPLGKQLA